MKKRSMVIALLGLLPLTGGCATLTQEPYSIDEDRAQRDRKCRVRFGWDDPICRFLDSGKVDAIGSGGN